jgi:hypothetical protein
VAKARLRLAMHRASRTVVYLVLGAVSLISIVLLLVMLLE